MLTTRQDIGALVRLPSQADRDLTRKLKDGGRLLDLPILDHLILSDQSYLSFADEGIL